MSKPLQRLGNKVVLPDQHFVGRGLGYQEMPSKILTQEEIKNLPEDLKVYECIGNWSSEEKHGWVWGWTMDDSTGEKCALRWYCTTCRVISDCRDPKGTPGKVVTMQLRPSEVLRLVRAEKPKRVKAPSQLAEVQEEDVEENDG